MARSLQSYFENILYVLRRLKSMPELPEVETIKNAVEPLKNLPMVRGYYRQKSDNLACVSLCRQTLPKKSSIQKLSDLNESPNI